MIDRLTATCHRLDDPDITTNIYQGLVTSADAIYHVDRLGPRRYLCSPSEKGACSYEVELEDDVMRPLISGVDAKRYITPSTKTYLLFPYDPFSVTGHLREEANFVISYPRSWAYLKSYEKALRGRESNKMDFDDGWWGYVYPKNLTLHEKRKIIVPRLVTSLVCSVDALGGLYLDNVDVGGIIVVDEVDEFFIAGLINSKVLNFVFQRISKPFRGNYLSANKQFIAPLPIPNASPEQAADVARRARNLQESHTARRDTLVSLAKRMETIPRRVKPETWLFPNLKSKREVEAEAPSTLDTEDRRAWAAKQFGDALEALHEAIGQRLNPGAALDAAFADGELSFSIDGVTVSDRIFESEA